MNSSLIFAKWIKYDFIRFVHSVAKCLGALTPCTKVFELCQKNKVISKLCTDKQAINACLKFAGKIFTLK